jgi:hypothetical protein
MPPQDDDVRGWLDSLDITDLLTIRDLAQDSPDDVEGVVRAYARAQRSSEDRNR